MKLGDDKHPDSHRFPDAPAAVARGFAMRFAAAVKDNPKAYLDIEAWRAELRAMLQETKDMVAEQRATVRADKATPEHLKQKAHRANAALLRDLKAAHAAVGAQIDQAAKLAGKARAERLTALWRNWIMPSVQLFGEVSGKDMAAPDWKAVTGELQKASSEQTILQIENAFMHGRFSTTEHSDYPIADVSGRLGNIEVKASAELRSMDVDTPEVREVMRALAARLSDPRLGLGPRVQQTIQALMSLWLTQRGADGYAIVHISQLAGILQYERTENGYHPDAYAAIREFVATAEKTSLQATVPDTSSGGKLSGRVEERAFVISYRDTLERPGTPEGDAEERTRVANRWTALKFRPNTLYSYAADRDGASLIKAFDPAINKLHPVHQLGELRLAKYLENHFRFNWNNRPGVIIRSVRMLLTEGMGLQGDDVERPNMATFTRLSDALDDLEQRGTIKHWVASDRLTAIENELAPKAGKAKRMTPSRWGALLEVQITIDAGGSYHKAYKNFGLTHQRDDVDPLLLALKEYVGTSARPQTEIARDLGITGPMLSQILSGKRRISEAKRDAVDRLVNEGRNLALPFDDAPG